MKIVFLVILAGIFVVENEAWGPRIRLPRIRLPRIRLPRIRLPRVRLPRIHLQEYVCQEYVCQEYVCQEYVCLQFESQYSNQFIQFTTKQAKNLQIYIARFAPVIS